MQPKLSLPRAVSQLIRSHTNPFQAVQSFFYVAGMMTTLSVTGGVVGCPQRSRPPPRPVFRRKITSAAVMRAMHVTQAMMECLGLNMDSGTAAASDGLSRLAEVGAMVETRVRDLPESSDAHTRHNRPAFRSLMTLRDSAGKEWPVIYEAFMSKRQYRRRFSDGLAAFRRCLKKHGSDGMLAVRVLRRRKDGGARK